MGQASTPAWDVHVSQVAGLETAADLEVCPPVVAKPEPMVSGALAEVPGCARNAVGLPGRFVAVCVRDAARPCDDVRMEPCTGVPDLAWQHPGELPRHESGVVRCAVGRDTDTGLHPTCVGSTAARLRRCATDVGLTDHVRQEQHFEGGGAQPGVQHAIHRYKGRLERFGVS